ncbi:MAG: tRNA threonylcarbamoyladenosine biosynthesis protein TsaB [Candidatus Rifleibacteriota bacterium]
MKYLFIDASETATCIQVGDSNSYFNQTFNTSRNLAACLTSICEEMLIKAGFKLEDVDVFAVGTGPGSLTGLRVANSFLRTLAFLGQKALVGIDLFTWSVATLKAQGQTGLVRLVTPTLIDKAFAVEADLSQSISQFKPAPQLVDDRNARPAIQNFGIRWQAENIVELQPAPEVLHQLIQQQQPSREFSEILQILPLYIIPSQAERKLEEKSC